MFKNKFTRLLIFTAVCSVIFVSMANLSKADEEQKVYVVKKGDTLWDITQQLLKDPFLWPGLWKINPEIKNPDIIYPGDEIILEGGNKLLIKRGGVNIAESGIYETGEKSGFKESGAMSSVSYGIGDNTENTSTDTSAYQDVPVKVEHETVDMHALAVSGYIVSPSELKKYGKIVGSYDGRTLMGQNDKVYLSPIDGNEMLVGQTYVVYRVDREVKHPKTHNVLGNLVKILGFVTIEDNSKNIMLASINTFYDFILKGDYIFPEEMMVDHSTAEPNPAHEAETGYIVAIKDEKTSSAQYDVVFLDLGKESGITVGDNYVVIRDPADNFLKQEFKTKEFKSQNFNKKTGPSFPGEIVGELEVISIQKNTSTAKIVKSLGTIFAGDIIKKK